MSNANRFFLGYGERLMSRVAPPGGGGGTEPAYSFDEAVTRLLPMLGATVQALRELPPGACPGGEVVGVVTLHPQWMAKSYHPQQLLNSYALRQVGSRPIAVQPDKWTRSSHPEPAASSELYVAGSRSAFERWEVDLESQPRGVSDQIRRLEGVRAPRSADRLKVSGEDSRSSVFEVILHASEAVEDEYIVAGFNEYARDLGANVNLEHRLYAGGLCFLPVEADEVTMEELSGFAFLRVARPMPRLRAFPDLERSAPTAGLPDIPLPTAGPVDPDLRVAVFDGGLMPSSPLTPWATAHDGPGLSSPTSKGLNHGHAVTSAALFGPLEPGMSVAPRPYGHVDHFRILDADSEKDPFELYEVLRRIDGILKSHNYEFINLSVGPDLPVEDDDVHTWTAFLDQHLADGSVLATVAVGNKGAHSGTAGEDRIQPPSDAVNALAVGASDSLRSDWKRAPYSSIGPGRSPGVMKPDVVNFGGAGASGMEQFLVYDADTAPALSQVCGTSFAAPATLRLALGLRSHFGSRFTPLALKALLVHSADPSEHHHHEVGWGRVESDLESIALCEDGMVRVIYQGELSPSQYVRTEIPMPSAALPGMVTIAATLCYATKTDPQDPGSYTRSGLEVTFRPHSGRFSRANSSDPKSASFFKKVDFETEQALRSDAQKWETTLHARTRKRASSLSTPVFDIHYNARTSGGTAREADKIKYALVVTVRAPRVANLYDEVVRAYSGQLEVFAPIIEIPVRI